MSVLGIDPSSLLSGYAVLESAEKLVEAGYLRPGRASDPAELRIEHMAVGLEKLIDEFEPEWIVIEVPSGRPGAGIKAGAKARLAIYGMAVGELRRVAKYKRPERVVSVNEREWTRGRTKGKRKADAALLFPQCREALVGDRGGDVADAIGVVLWWYGCESRRMIGCT